MDQITIQELEVFAHHGVYEEEQKLGQRFVVSTVLELCLETAGEQDALSETVNYGEVAREMTTFLQQHTFQLLEAAAQQLAEHLLLTYPSVRAVELELKKPWAPIGLPLRTVSVRIRRGWQEVYLSLGSNLGDRRAYLEQAVEALRRTRGIRVLQVTDWMETKPYGVLEQPDFLNGCARLATWLSPEVLLDVLQTLEQSAGRERTQHWGPRTLDLDLLLYGDEIIGTKRLVVPHPELEKREFVLRPMNELAPWKRHPISKKTMRGLLEELTGEVQA